MAKNNDARLEFLLPQEMKDSIQYNKTGMTPSEFIRQAIRAKLKSDALAKQSFDKTIERQKK